MTELQEKKMDKERLLECDDQTSHPDETIQNLTRSRSDSRYLRWLLVTLVVAYLPLVGLYVSLYRAENGRNCNGYDAFPGGYRQDKSINGSSSKLMNC